MKALAVAFADCNLDGEVLIVVWVAVYCWRLVIGVGGIVVAVLVLEPLKLEVVVMELVRRGSDGGDGCVIL